MLLDAGVEPVGDAAACHAVAVDARAPKFDGGIVTRLDCIPFGIVVNVHGQRFGDEGEDFWPKRYAEWGSLVARQPDQTAFVIIDAKVAGAFMPSVYPPIVAGSIAELAAQLRLPAEALQATVAAFNDAVQPGTRQPRGAGRLPHERADAGEVALGAADRHAALSGPIRCGRGSRSPTLACAWTCRRGWCCERARRRATSSPPGK